MKAWVLGFVFAFALAGSPAYADVWDTSTDNDDSAPSTDTELVHGSDQIHDLGFRPGPVPDQDWYKVLGLLRTPRSRSCSMASAAT